MRRVMAFVLLVCVALGVVAISRVVSLTPEIRHDVIADSVY